MKIPLFDVDSTLLKGGNKAHDGAFDYAMKTVYNSNASRKEIQAEGKIDPQIIIEALGLHNVSTEKAKDKIEEAMDAMLSYFLKHEDEGEYIVLPGVKDLLTTLKQKGAYVGVLTGNVEGIGWRKLEIAGIKRFIGFGAFGNLAFRRPELVPIAEQRARDLYKKDFSPFDPDLIGVDFVIIGDTPLDIACAKEAGIQSIGVASGYYSVEDLKKAGADLVVKSLKEKDKIVKFLTD